MQTNRVLEWADGSYDFKLTWAGCSDVERAGDAGIIAIYSRVMNGGAYKAEIAEIIRQGLTGGSGGEVDGEKVETDLARVRALMERYVTGPEALPISASLVVAQAIIHTAMVGYEPAQKKSAARRAKATGSTSEKSSPTAQ